MSQTGLFVALHILGLSVCLAFGRAQRPGLCCTLGFPVGLAIASLWALILLITGVPCSPLTISSGVLLAWVAALIAIERQGRIRKQVLRTSLIYSGVFAALCVGITSVNVSTMSYDSHLYVMWGLSVVSDQALGPGLIALLDGRGVMYVIAHSFAAFTNESYLYSLSPIFGLSLIPLFSVALWHGVCASAAPARGKILVALVSAVLFTIGAVVYHILYIHTNMASAVYLFGFVALFWLAETKDDATLLPVAFICLTAFALQRTETTPVALLFLALTVTLSQLPRRTITRCLAAFSIIVIAWWEVVAQNSPESASFTSPMRARMVWLAVVAFFLWWLASSWPLMQRVNRLLPWAIPLLCAMSLVAAFVYKPDHMGLSTGNWLRTMTELPYWGKSTYLTALLALLALTLRAIPFRHAFVSGTLTFLGFVALLGVARKAYVFGFGDSADRMTLHVLPLIFFYFGLKFIPTLAPKNREQLEVR